MCIIKEAIFRSDWTSNLFSFLCSSPALPFFTPTDTWQTFGVWFNLSSSSTQTGRQTVLRGPVEVNKGHGWDEELMILLCFCTTFCLSENYFILIPPTDATCLSCQCCCKLFSGLIRETETFICRKVSWKNLTHLISSCVYQCNMFTWNVFEF